jgi:hypothetical protein
MRPNNENAMKHDFVAMNDNFDVIVLDQWNFVVVVWLGLLLSHDSNAVVEKSRLHFGL